MNSYVKQSGLARNICSVGDCVFLSSWSVLSLFEYLTARKAYCSDTHQNPCTKCSGMLEVANSILKQGYCILSDAFRLVSPTVKCTADHARRKFLQIMPLACIRIGDPLKVNYNKLGAIINALLSTHCCKDSRFS